MSQTQISNRVRAILSAEAAAIANIPLNGGIEQAVEAVLRCSGKVFTTGIGKAGYVARKAASTLSTTGTPAAFLHPADASHGDVGAVSRGDLLLGFSNSGRTREVLETVHFCRRLGASSILTVTSSRETPLGEESDVVIEIGSIPEVCPFGLTPTASTAAMIAVADALAIIVMEQRGFTRADFALRHHGGYLGKISREEEQD